MARTSTTTDDIAGRECAACPSPARRVFAGLALCLHCSSVREGVYRRSRMLPMAAVLAMVGASEWDWASE